MIPNTTPTPNELYNGEMKKMSDTELRVVLIVTRATLGWVIDKETGMRKTEDWISHNQLIKKSGKSSRAISYAVDSCVKKRWIETRDETGKLLKTAEERKLLGKKIFYRLGKIFLDKTITIANDANLTEPSQMTTPTIANDDTKPSQQLRTTKERITKERITKEQQRKSVAGSQINLLIEKFKLINPTYERLFRNTTQRQALERLVKKFGFEKIENVIDVLPEIVGKKYAPRITTPYVLEQKLGSLGAYIKERSENNKGKEFVI